MDIAVIGPVCKDEIVIHGNIHYQMGSIPYYVGTALQTLGHGAVLYITHAAQDNEWIAEHLGSIPYKSIYSPQTLTVYLEYDTDNPNKRKQKVQYVPHTIQYHHLGDAIEDHETIVMGPLFYHDIDPLLFEQLSHKKVVLGNFGMITYSVDATMTKQYPERARAVLPHVDYLFMDEEEILFLTEKKTIDEAIESICDVVPAIIVTLGSRGSIVHIQGRRYTIPAFTPKEIVDPTGSGDTYLAAFLAKEKETDDYDVIGRFAAMAATCKIEKKGPLTTSKDEIEKRIINYGL